MTSPPPSTPTPAPSSPRVSSSAPGRTAAQLLALIGYTLRESLHKWTLLAFLLVTTLFLLMLASTVSLDVVEGTLASARLFGQQLELADEGIRITDVVAAFQTAIAVLLYTAGLFMAIFTTGNLIPRICTRGWVGSLVALPVSRSALILGRTVGAVAVVALNIGYLVVGSWAILTWKTGVGNSGFLIAGALIVYTFAVCYAGMVLIGVITRSSPVSIMFGAVTWVGGLVAYGLHAHPGWRLSLAAGWRRQTAAALTDAAYWTLPKTYELGEAVSRATKTEGFDPTAVWTSAPYAVVALGVACWWFSREDL